MVDAYLRPGECLRLGSYQVLRPTDQEGMGNPALLLHPDERGLASNTGEMNEGLLIQRPWLGELLMGYLSKRRPGALWDFDLRVIRTVFLRACGELGLQR